MDVVTGAIGSLISKLSELFKEEYNLHKSARPKVESLINELEYAHAALRKVGAVPPNQLQENVRIWAREVRVASYDMEDVIDTFLVHVSDRHKEHSADQESFFNRLLATARGLIGMPSKRREISGAIDDINRRLEDVTQRYGRYTVVDSIIVARPESLDPRLAAMYKEVTELVGIEESSSELIAMLLPIERQAVTSSSDHETMKMVSVVGVGGLGKTTLAKSVYDKVKVDFECSAFVPVGRSPDFKEVFRDILRQIDKNKYNEDIQFYNQANVRQLIDELRETFLGNKRYLIVIDDIWETKSWETIKLALVEKKSGSRVITTTRILDVAKEAGKVYKLQHLPYDTSKKLLYTRIFGAEDKCQDNQLDEISDKILKKCDGVPLAVITMASLLVNKTHEERIEVCNSIAFRDRDNKQVSDTEWILSLSYYDLPPHLKTCLLYLSVFPEDHIISKYSLIWMWVAEGFVHNNTGTRLFEVGNGYFNELINRSMIQAVESEEDDDVVVGCRVHDMVLDLLLLKSKEENFVTVSSNNAEAISSPSRVRRLSHQNKNKMAKHIQMDMEHVRSFVACKCGIDEAFSFQSFKLLRVLALEHCRIIDGGEHFTPCLKHLENLLHLRYLGLGYSYILEIPEEIGALRFLQTLDLEGASVKQTQLPLSVCLLEQLISLRARCMYAPNGLTEKLTALEQLEIRVPHDTVWHFVKELGKLRELRVLYADLGPQDDLVEKRLVLSLRKLHKIQHLELKLECGLISFLDKAVCEAVVLSRPLRHLIVPELYFVELPLHISPSDLPNLTHLNLSVHYMEDQHLKILGQLPELRHLKLQIKSPDNVAAVTLTSTACTSTITDCCFQKLRFLSFPNSAVQFVLNEDSSVMFVLNEDLISIPIPFSAGNSRTMDVGTKKRDKCILAPAAMPNLQVLEFEVYVESKVNNCLGDNLGLDCLPSLQRVKVTLWWSSCPYDLEREKDALRQAIEGHPNQPTLQMCIEGEESDQEEEEEEEEEEEGE